MLTGHYQLAAVGPVPAVLVVVLFVVIIVAIVALTRRADISRKQAFVTEFARLNMVGSSTPTADQKNTAFARCASVQKELHYGSKAVQWFAELPDARPQIFFCEHMYVVSNGKSSHRVYRTIASAITPRAWATTSLTRENVFTKIGKVFGLKDLDLENAAFNNAWRVRASDENFALALITPELQTLLADRSAMLRGERWVIASGTLCLVLNRAIKPDELASVHARLMQFINALAPELRNQLDGFNTSM